MPARVKPAYMSTLASAETVPRAEVVRAWSRFIMTGKSRPPTVKAPASRATPAHPAGRAGRDHRVDKEVADRAAQQGAPLARSSHDPRPNQGANGVAGPEHDHGPGDTGLVQVEVAGEPGGGKGQDGEVTHLEHEVGPEAPQGARRAGQGRVLG